MGLHAPAVMIVSFVPMLLIAAAYNYMNKADPDCGTSFTWVTRAMGPHLGWLTGWAIVAADIVVMATLAYIAGVYTFLLFGLDAAPGQPARHQHRRRVWIAVMTWICYIGIELSARTQYFLLAMEIFTLALFAVVALWKVYVTGVPDSVHIGLSWFNPFNIPGGTTALIDGVLLGVFIYWGWDSGVCVNEESKDSANGPGKAAVMSTDPAGADLRRRRRRGAGLPRTGFPHQQRRRRAQRAGRQGFRLAARQAADHRGADLGVGVDPDDDPADRADDALDGALRVDPEGVRPDPPRYLTPDVSTLAMGAVSLVWTLFIINVSTRTSSPTRSPGSASRSPSTTG